MCRKLFVTLSSVPLCCALMSADLLADEELEVTGSTTVAVQTVDIEGDEAGAQKYRDGLEDTVAVETIDLKGEKADFFFSLQGGIWVRTINVLSASSASMANTKSRVAGIAHLVIMRMVGILVL